MRRVGAGAGRRMGANRVSFGDRTPLMDWRVGGTFTRASSASTRPSPQSVQRYAAGERRFENGRLLVETLGVYVSRQSKTLNDAYWTKTNCTVTTDAVAGPDGTLTADGVVTTLDGLNTEVSQTFAVAASGNTTASFWVRGDSAFTGSVTLAGTTSASQDFAVTTDWQQIVVQITGTTVAASIAIRPHAAAETGVAGRTMYVWEVCGTNSTLVQSTVGILGSSVTRPADSLTYAVGDWNTALATGSFSVEWCPNTDSGGINSVIDLLSFGGASDRIGISNTDAVIVIQAGATMVSTSPITYSRDQVITFTFRPASGQVVVAGASTGNGTYTGTAWTMPTAVTLRVGGRVGSTAECCGGLGNPYPA